MAGIPIKLENVWKQFGNTVVLKGINLELKSGEFLAIVGRSGCGKSTLLRLISGIEPITSGSILLDQQRINGTHPLLRIMFQDDRLLPWKTVLENVELGLQKKNKALAKEALKRVGLEHKHQD